MSREHMAGWDGAMMLPTAAHRGCFLCPCPGPQLTLKLEKTEATPATCSTGPRSQVPDHSPPGEQLHRDPGFPPKQLQAESVSHTEPPSPPGSKQQVVFSLGKWGLKSTLGSLATIAIICPALKRGPALCLPQAGRM